MHILTLDLWQRKSYKAVIIGLECSLMYKISSKIVWITKYMPHTETTPTRAHLCADPLTLCSMGDDLVGTLPTALGRFKFLVVSIDYFTKWAAVEALTSILGKKNIKILRKNIVCKFWSPHKILSDKGKQFANDPFKSWYKGLNITQLFNFVAHPKQTGKLKWPMGLS